MIIISVLVIDYRYIILTGDNFEFILVSCHRIRACPKQSIRQYI